MHQYSYFSFNHFLIRIFQNVVIFISVWSLLYRFFTFYSILLTLIRIIAERWLDNSSKTVKSLDVGGIAGGIVSLSSSY
jgi:hypothetical protein